MNGKTMMCAAAVLAMAGAVVVFPALAAEPTITVTAQQRYPWNGMVDVAFTIAGESGAKYDTSFVARDVAGGTNLTMNTVYKSDGSEAALTNVLAVGSYKWVWNAAADLPDGFVGDRIIIAGNAVRATDMSNALYMVVDLSGGSSAESYPVSYLTAIPSGGWSDEYKKTKLVLCAMPAGSFTMGNSSSNKHKVTISKRFYIGVFEVTQKQYQLIVGSNPAGLTGDMRPVETVSYQTVRGSTNGAKWPTSNSVDASSFMGKLRTRLNLTGVDLPTSAQWEYACRAGTTTSLNNGLNTTGSLTCTNVAKVARYYGNQSDWSGTWDKKGGYTATTKVGLYNPNRWGLYDMHGNVWEMCLDWYSTLGTTAATDPKGPTSGSYRVIRGGDWYSAAYELVQGRHIGYYNYSYNDYYHTPSFSSDHVGFRIVINP